MDIKNPDIETLAVRTFPSGFPSDIFIRDTPSAWQLKHARETRKKRETRDRRKVLQKASRKRNR